MKRKEALELVDILLNPKETQRKKVWAAARLSELICILLPETESETK